MTLLEDKWQSLASKVGAHTIHLFMQCASLGELKLLADVITASARTATLNLAL